MALPTKQKTWQFDVNNLAASGTELARNQRDIYNIKEAMTGFALNPWVVTLSSNTVTAGVGDNIASPTDIIWSTGTVYTWFVLRHVSGTELLFSFREGSEYQLDLYVSRNDGFTGGATNALPTATDQATIAVSRRWRNSSTTGYQEYSHVWHSDDGNMTYVTLTGNGTVNGFWALGIPSQTTPSWTDPFIVSMSENQTFETVWKSNFYANFQSVNSFAIGSGYTLTSGPTANTFAHEQHNIGNNLEGAGEIYPIWIGVDSGGVYDGVHGLLDDHYAITAAIGAPGDMTSGGNEWVKAGSELLLPWDVSLTNMLMS